MIKGLSNNYGLKLLKVSQHHAKFDGHAHCGSGDMMALVCHMISQEKRDQRLK